MSNLHTPARTQAAPPSQTAPPSRTAHPHPECPRQRRTASKTLPNKIPASERSPFLWNAAGKQQSAGALSQASRGRPFRPLPPVPLLSSATCLQNAGRMEGHLNNSKGFAPLSLLSALLMNPKHFSLSLSLSFSLSIKVTFQISRFHFSKKKENRNSTRKSTRNLRMRQRATARQLATVRQPEGAATLRVGNPRLRGNPRPCDNLQPCGNLDRATTCDRVAGETNSPWQRAWQRQTDRKTKFRAPPRVECRRPSPRSSSVAKVPPVLACPSPIICPAAATDRDRRS